MPYIKRLSTDVKVYHELGMERDDHWRNTWNESMKINYLNFHWYKQGEMFKLKWKPWETMHIVNKSIHVMYVVMQFHALPGAPFTNIDYNFHPSMDA